MIFTRIYTIVIFLVMLLSPPLAMAGQIVISNKKMSLTLDYGQSARITLLIVNGQKVITGDDGIFTSISTNGNVYSSLRLNKTPVLVKTGNLVRLNNISYGDKNFSIHENWLFTINVRSIKWTIQRTTNKSAIIAETGTPVFKFDSIGTWEGAYQGYGGLAWFYLFNQKLCTYGVHTRSSDFWNSKTGNGLNITVNANGRNVAMKYTRTNDDKVAYTISTSQNELLPKLDSGTHRRRFINGRTDIWSPFRLAAGTTTESITLTPFDFGEKYGRGKFNGLNGTEVSNVLNTIARIGVIDSLHFGGNSWHTPYGPICLHEQYIAQMGLGINDPKYLAGYQSCLDFYCAHAIKPDGRVYPRWAYTNEDAAPGQFNKYGFYEAQWGILMDSNPDLVTNISDLYNMTGNKVWVKSHQLACEKILNWILARDSNHNGLVEMMTDNEQAKKSSDWIDIIWASYENAFVNAKLYHALVEWADIEHQLNNEVMAKYYVAFAARLKASFNRSTKNGGFWDEEKGCYVHWLDKDGSAHGNNMVTPVNFMAIAYGICDDGARKKIILDGIETQMKKENLFFWPLAMYSYAPGEGNGWQFPFPAYENGDIFLSWGSIAVKAYAEYDPALAVKYVKNVLDQYSKDGLAYQRYGRIKQNGLGDDILSGNSLAITGLYQAIYGINPLYNRFYLDPHITPELSGTILKYNYQGKKLVISLDSSSYAVLSGGFKITAGKDFGFNAAKNSLSYFNRDMPDVALQAATAGHLSITIKNWNMSDMKWEQHNASGAVNYTVHRLKPDAVYSVIINGAVKKMKCSSNGELMINYRDSNADAEIEVQAVD
jgi:hypothetical protein